jgi:hypothetical protein
VLLILISAVVAETYPHRYLKVAVQNVVQLCCAGANDQSKLVWMIKRIFQSPPFLHMRASPIFASRILPCKPVVKSKKRKRDLISYTHNKNAHHSLPLKMLPRFCCSECREKSERSCTSPEAPENPTPDVLLVSSISILATTVPTTHLYHDRKGEKRQKAKCACNHQKTPPIS